MSIAFLLPSDGCYLLFHFFPELCHFGVLIFYSSILSCSILGFPYKSHISFKFFNVVGNIWQNILLLYSVLFSGVVLHLYYLDCSLSQFLIKNYVPYIWFYFSYYKTLTNSSNNYFCYLWVEEFLPSFMNRFCRHRTKGESWGWQQFEWLGNREFESVLKNLVIITLPCR